VATSVAGRSLGTRRVWVRRSIGPFGCLLVVLGLTVASAAADEPKVVSLWPEGVPDAQPEGGDERVEKARKVQVRELAQEPVRRRHQGETPHEALHSR